MNTAVHQKPTHEDQNFNFEQFLSLMSDEVGTLLHRAEHLISEEEDGERNMQHYVRIKTLTGQ